MSNHRTIRRGTALAAVAALGLTLAACGTDDGGSEGGEGADKKVTLGYIPSWTDGLTMAYLLDNQLSAAGYEVEHEEISEAGVLYTALSEGDVDLYPSAWSGLHSSYIEQYGDDLENLGDFYEGGKKFLAVPEYTDIDSLAELPDNVDKFDGTITGIEPSAGLMEDTKDLAVPAYGLDEAGYTLQDSSTSAMLTALGEAIDNKEDILVTMWTPFWANGSYPIKALEDPEGAFSDVDNLQFMSHAGFGEDHPEVADWLGQVKLTDEQYSSLEKAVAVDSADDPAAGVETWLKENPDVIPAFEG
ncbi:glycine betaine ABC transporter substrate-binding protein [Isoptericola sp. 4D.3]|jgi:glycine betaine/proline transport system substrate-binding protein|uniref:Glycine betaine ABC transporter substrate-binding protein n=1 Tax=Isoptericola peretonis TaxID=2918523 RepID=A0ABT0J6B7_9MICO|nr:glycine betaine ABC transporter substrate-binding protein [Isoptericola sp. 4D.3]